MPSSNRTILVTGGAGFIGFHLTKHFLDNFHDVNVVSIDNMNSYYDQQLKKDRLNILNKYPHDRFEFYKLDLTDREALSRLFSSNDFHGVINLAAQAGVRYARKNPESYIESNIKGFFNLIDLSAKQNIDKFMYASSSSVYGSNTSMPFNEQDLCNSPMSLYAATKLSNEHIASSYFYSYKFKSIGLRFFNVYGPWGRPDMAYYKWTDALLSDKPIELRNKGNMYRDMTYIDDVVTALTKIMFEFDWQNTHDVFNIGNTKPVKIKDVLNHIQERLNIYTKKLVYAEKGDEEPIKTFADTQKLKRAIKFAPNTDYRVGLDNFLNWYKQYYLS